MSSIQDLQAAVVSYQALIHNFGVVRSNLLARRRTATDQLMVELDDRLKANERTIDALRRAVEVSTEHIDMLKRSAVTAQDGSR